jgi:hypothetical protein
MTADDLDLFTMAYIDAMLWSSDDDDGHQLDANHSAHDIDPDCLAAIVADCQAFQAKFGPDFLEAACLTRTDAIEQAGHDFWLTRAGHGVGFWETSDWSEEAGAAMDAYCEEVGEFYIYDADGKIYAS